MALSDINIIIPIVLSLAAFMWQGLTWFASKRKRKLDETDVLTGMAMNLVNELQDEISRLKGRIKELEGYCVQQTNEYNDVLKRLDIIEHENKKLKRQISQLQFENRELQKNVTKLREENTKLRKQTRDGKIM